MQSRQTAIIVALAGLILAALLFSPQLISFYVDWLWFSDLGYERIFLTMLNAQLLSAFAGLAAGFSLTFLNLIIASRATRGKSLIVSFQGQDLPQINFLKHFEKINYIIPLLTGIVIALSFYSQWFSFLSYLNASGFSITDPILHKDAAFYIFSMPVLEMILYSLLVILGISVVSSGLHYFFKGSLFFSSRGVHVERAPSLHLSILIAAIFIALSGKSYLEMHALLYSSSGHVAGATYSDVYAVIPMAKLKMALAVAVAFIIGANIFLRRKAVVLGAVGLYIAVSFLGTSLYPALLQKFVVAPNELVKETPYIRNNIEATRAAFGLASVEERDLPGSSNLDSGDISANRATIKNIRLWDHRPLLDTYSQVQEIRTYYEFTTVGNDRYMINGEYLQTMLSPRELSTESIPTRNWINETLTFTHGYGLTLGPVTQITPEGLPVLLVKDIPPSSAAGSPVITRPEIYYGKLMNNYVIVNTQAKEFDYPSGDENVFTSYNGNRGVRIDSLMRKIAFSAFFRSMKLLLSNDISRESRVLFNRNISDRVRKLMPFLMFDSDPYMVVSGDGRLFWIYDAYTVSGRYPYSQPIGKGINYIRNSVKITIDAYDGTTVFYISDSSDPVISTYENIFPGVFRPLSDMPDDIRHHVRYPLDIFTIQTLMYSTYHMEDPQIFYNREDQWEIPALGGGTQREVMEPYYTIMKLPGEEKEEFILMLPFTPKKKDNLSAWMVARSDGDYYGNLVVYRFPKDRLVYGPKQIVARINQDTEISRQISLWDQRGSQVIQGTLLIIPIESSLIYVQPLYLRAESGKIPELKRVMVAYENKIAMEPTLDAALARIFGGTADVEISLPAVEETSKEPSGDQSLAAQANAHYRKAMEALRSGNWSLYGTEIENLGQVLKKMLAE